MMSNSDLKSAGAAVREAFAQNRFDDALRLLPAYTEAVARERNPEAAREAMVLIEWARRLTLVRRSGFAAHLAALLGRPRYSCASAPQSRSTWELHG